LRGAFGDSGTCILVSYTRISSDFLLPPLFQSFFFTSPDSEFFFLFLPFLVPSAPLTMAPLHHTTSFEISLGKFTAFFFFKYFLLAQNYVPLRTIPVPILPVKGCFPVLSFYPMF